MPEEKKIGALKNKHKNIGKFIREMFDFMLMEWDGADWTAIPINERKLLINQMSWANIFYLYIYQNNTYLDIYKIQMAYYILDITSSDLAVRHLL